MIERSYPSARSPHRGRRDSPPQFLDLTRPRLKTSSVGRQVSELSTDLKNAVSTHSGTACSVQSRLRDLWDTPGLQRERAPVFIPGLRDVHVLVYQQLLHVLRAHVC